MVVDEVELAIKELPLEAVFAPSPVGVDQGQPVVLLVERPMGEDHLVESGHLDLPGQAGVLHQAGLRTHHSARECSRAPGVRVSGPDWSVVKRELAQVFILLSATQVNRGLRGSSNDANDLLVVEGDVVGEEALGEVVSNGGRRRGGVGDLVALAVHQGVVLDDHLEGDHLPHHLVQPKSHGEIAHHSSAHSLQQSSKPVRKTAVIFDHL